MPDTLLLRREQMSMEHSLLFTSESVSEGHPDKLCDQISDAVLDACLADDQHARVACETFATTGMVLVGGEITTTTYVSLPDLVRSVVKDIGYTDPGYGLDYESMAVMSTIDQQSPDIAMGVDENEKKHKPLGAGDQGMMFGFACSETQELMPAPIMFSHKLMMRAAELRKSGKISWLRPDAKSQVTVEYVSGKIARIHTIVISHQHGPEVSRKQLEEAVRSEIIAPVLEQTGLIDGETRYFINPTGRFVRGGPHADTGLTGRKIVVDTYGGMGRHGGGAFSGKDPSKVDRSAAYMARYLAKNLVASGVCSRCEVQLSYAIGVAEPISVMVDTFGTGLVPDWKIAQTVMKEFDLTPGAVIRYLQLLHPIYRRTAAYGHFGRDAFTWEKTDKADYLKRVLPG